MSTQVMLRTAAIIVIVAAATGQTASIQASPALNEARTDVSVDGSLALKLFEYLLYHYKSNKYFILQKLGYSDARTKDDGYPFEGLAITTGVLLIIAILAIVFQPLVDNNRFFRSAAGRAGRFFDSDAGVTLTQTVLRSIQQFQDQINANQLVDN